MDTLAIKGGTPVRTNKIGYGHQWIDEDDIEAVAEVLIIMAAVWKNAIP